VAKLGKPAAAVTVMAGIIAILLTLCTPRSTSRSSAIDRSTPREPSAPRP
jgi:hypothetical protein